MRVTLTIGFVGWNRAVASAAAAAWVLLGGARLAGASDFSGGPVDDPPISSMGVVKVIVASKFTPAMAGYPGFFAPNKLYSPVLIDNGTVIGRSAPHNNGIAGTVPVGNLGTPVGYANYAPTPPDFVNPLAPTREVFTEIRKMRLVTSGAGSCSNRVQDPRLPTVPPGIPIIMAGPDGGASAPALPRSLGQVQSKTPGGNPANDFPARSFFDVFVEVNLPPVGAFPGVQLRNSQPMVVTNQLLTAFPPAVIYIHGATTASPLVFKSAGTLNGIPYVAGEVFGWLVLAGHGTQIDCSDSTAVQNFINTVLGPPNDENPGLPLPGPNIVYVSDPPVAGFSGPGAGFTDQGYITLLQNAGYNVIRYNPPDSQNTLLTAAELSALNTNDLVIIGRALASAAFQAPQVAQWNNAITKPVLCLNGYLSRSSRMGWTTGGPTQPDDTPTPLTAANPTDPKVDFLLSDVDMLGLTTVLPYDETIDRNTSQLSDPPVAGGTVLLTASYVQEPGGTATSPIASDLPAGTPVRGGAENVAGYRLYFSTGSRESATAPNGIPQYTGRENLTPTGEKIFLRAVQLALNGGTVPQTDPATPMSISRPPTSVTVLQGSSATFSVRAVGAAPRTLQWQRDGVDIPGANTLFQMSSITISNVSLADNGAQFRVVASNPNGSVFSASATLTVLPDTAAPVVLSAGSLDSVNIGVCFDELLDQGTAEDQFNYDLSDANGASIMSVKLQPDGRSVVLTVAPPLSANFTLTVRNAKDRFANEFSAPVVVNGVNLGLTGVDVGTLNPPGTNATCGANSFQVTGGGLDVAGTADSMRLVYKTMTGDFDIRARVTAITGTPDHLETTTKALLVARDGTAANAASVDVYVTPLPPGDNSVGAIVRASTGAAAAALGTTYVPSGLPNGWIRLRRLGNLFTAYRSPNGVDWVELGNTSLALPASLSVGAGVVSHRNGKLATATFADFSLGTPPVTYEGLQHFALGQANLSLSGNLLTVANIGSSGQDGVSIDLGRSAGWEGNFQPLDLSAQGSSYSSALYGQVNGQSNQVIASSSVTAGSQGNQLSVNFAPIGSASSRVTLYGSNNTVITQFNLPNNQPLQIINFNWRICRNVYYCDINPNSPLYEVVRYVSYTYCAVQNPFGPDIFQGVGAVTFEATDQTATINGASSVQMTAAGVPSITMTNEAVQFAALTPFVSAEGGVLLAPLANVPQLTVANIGSSGQDGVSIELGRTEGWNATLLGNNDMSKAGVIANSSMIGRVNGVDGRVIGTGRIQGTGSNTLLSVDFANIGSPSSAVSLYDANGVSVGGFNIANNTSMIINLGGSWGPPYWCRIGWRCEPARDVAVYGWCFPICIINPINPTLIYPNVSRIEVSALNISVPRDYVSEGRITASGVQSLVLTSVGTAPPTGPATVNYDGLPVTPVGQASLALSGNLLTVANIGSSGQDGVAVDLGKAAGWQGNFQPVDLSAPGASYASALYGQVNGLSNSVIASSTLTANAQGNLLAVDFSPIGSTSSRVTLYGSNDTFIARFNVPNNEALQIVNGGWRICRNVYYCDVNPNSPLYEVVRYVSYTYCVIQVGPIIYQNVAAVTFEATDQTGTVNWASRAQVTVAGIPSITMTNQAIQFAPLTAFASAEGSALLQPLVTAPKLTVANIGSSGQDGVSFELGKAAGWGATLAGNDDMSQAGVRADSSMIGRVNGANGQVIGAGRIQGTGSNALLSVNFANIGSPTSAVSLYDSNGVNIAGFDIANNTSMIINIGGTWAPPYWCRIGWRCEPTHDIAIYGWCFPICLVNPINPALVYNNVSRIEVSALNISATREFVSEGRLNAIGLPSLVVTGQTTQSLPGPALVNPAYANGTFSASFQTQAGVTYAVQSRDALNSASQWSTFSTVNGDGTVKVITDSRPLSTTKLRLYRLVSP